jgi:hypothetical protein
MRKSAIALACIGILVLAGAAAAQPAVGLKAGLSLAKITGDDVGDVQTKAGFMIGGFAAFPLGENTALQPEILYTQKGAKADGLGGEEVLSLNYIDVPILFRFTVAGEGARPIFLLGPSIGFKASDKFTVGGEEVEIGDFKSTDFGLVFGLGAQIQQFVGEVRYNLGLTNILDVPDEANTASIKNSVISLQAGFTFN